jgi:hypothetical protein
VITTHDVRKSLAYTHELLVAKQAAVEIAAGLTDRQISFAVTWVPAGHAMFHLSPEGVPLVEFYLNRTPYELQDSDRE